MSTDLPAPREGHTAPTDTTPEELPAWARQIDWDNLTPGHITKVPADGDLPAGYVEVVHPAEYQRNLERAVAIERGPSGRAAYAARLAARGTGILLGWTATGTIATAVHAHRYYRAHDYAECLGLPLDEAAEKKVRSRRRERWKVIGWSAAALSALNAAGWGALVWGAGMTAAGSWAIIPGAEGVSLLAGLTAYGRYRKQHQVLPGQVVAPQHAAELEAVGAPGVTAAVEQEDDGEPYPLKYAKDSVQIEECVRRAFAAEGIGVRSLRLRDQSSWGCEVDVTLKGKGSTPAKVNSLAGSIDTHLGLPKGGTLVEPDVEEADHITLRLVQGDPFADMPDPTIHASGSLSVRDLAGYGRGMDGTPLEFRLRGMSMLVIGSSGSAKTKGALRSLLEAITACSDAIAIEMDPVKDGLTEFAGVMAAPPIRGGTACTEWLRHLRDIASARNAVKTRKDMGDLWEPSPEYPSIYGVVDEFIYLPQEAKDLAIEILRIGRETGVHLIFAAQEATEDALGDAIASAVTYRIMLASRSEDVRLVFGAGAAGDGYRPDRLRPAVDDERVYDAGKFFIKGPGFERPILWRWHRLSRDQIKQAVVERSAKGRPWFDRDSLSAAGLTRLERQRPSEVPAPDRRSIVADSIEVMDEQDVEGMFPEVLADALAEMWPDEYGELTADELKAELKAAGAGAPVPLGKRDDNGQRRRGFKRNTIAALPR